MCIRDSLQAGAPRKSAPARGPEPAVGGAALRATTPTPGTESLMLRCPGSSGLGEGSAALV
eukprot:8222787-Alexandrium_andersonii.AAC.1